MSDRLSSIQESIDIDAPVATVWKFLVGADHVHHWLGCMRYEPKVGSVFYMQPDGAKRAADDIEGATHCEVLALEEPTRFEFSWYLPGTPRTTVAVELTPQGTDRTRVVLEHSGWAQFDAASVRPIHEALRGGWKSHVLPGLKAFVEGHPAAGIPTRAG